jgi:ribonuclease HII
MDMFNFDNGVLKARANNATLEVAIPQQAIIKGDAKSASIAAASVLAFEPAVKHPGY